MIQIKNNFSWKNWGLGLIAWVIIVATGLTFRFYPLIYHTSDMAQEQATVLVLTKLRAESLKEAALSSYDLSDTERNRLAKQIFDNNLKNQKIIVRKDIDELAKKIDQKNPENDRGPFLLEADPFYYFALTKNILKTGHMSDTRLGSKYLNKLMLAPEGHWEPFNLHPFVGVFVYQIMTILQPQISLMKAVSFTPLLLMILTTLPFLMICRLMRHPPFITFTALAMFLLSPIYAKRSAFGWYDNDPYNIFFPLMILAALFWGLENIIHQRKNILLALTVAALMATYAFFWQGWVYLFCIILISGIFVVIYHHFVLKDKETTKPIIIYFATLFFAILIGISLSFGIKDFFILFAEGWKALKNFMAPQLALWPDLYMNVGELRKSSFSDISDLTGGAIFFLCALLGAIAGIIQLTQRSPKKDTSKFIILICFLVSSILITLGAQRFALLTLIPLSLLFPVGLNWIYQSIESLVVNKAPLTFNKKIVSACIFIVFSLSVITWSTIKLHEAMYLWRPIYNDTWDRTLGKIRNETPKNSVINTWWPPGHFITSMSERRVTFDGATINNPQAYWLAKVFLSSDELYAAGMLRMLNNSANQAAEYLQQQNIPLSKAVDIIQSIVIKNRLESQKLLESILAPNQQEDLLTLTHATPPPTYCLIYSEFFEKNLELSFVGKWNFRKIEQLNSDPEAMKRIPPRKSKNFVKFLWDLVGGPLNYSEILGYLTTKGSTLYFEHNLQIDLETMDCHIDSDKFGRGIPQSIFYLKDGQVTEKQLAQANLRFSVVLFKKSNHYGAIIMDRRLGESLLIKLFFFEGAGLKYFELFGKETDLTGRNQIYVYQVNWDKFFEDIHQKP